MLQVEVSMDAVFWAVQNVTTKRKHSLQSQLDLHHFGFHMWLQISYHVTNADLFIIEQFKIYVIFILINRSHENRSL